MNLAIKILWPDPAPINSEACTTLAFYLPIGVFIAGQQGPQGEQGPQGDPADPAVTDDLQAQIDAIYDAGGGNAALQNATYENGVLHYTGGTVPTPIGDRNGCSLTVPAYTQITLGYQPDTLTAGQSLIYLWHTSADAATALTDYLSNGYPGLSIIAQPNGFYVRVDGLSSGSLADPGPTVINLAGRRLQIDVPGVPNASYETPETAGPAPAYLHIFSSADVGSAVADAAFDLSPAPSVATGLLPDETAARIAADAALQDQIDDVQTLAEINQLSILEKADQVDLDTLQTTVTDNGLVLAQKASQADLDTLATEVSTKATPADISAAIAALVDGAPASLDTLAEIAAELAGDQASINDLLTQINNRVRFDAAQSLTTAQQLQARQNINAEKIGVAAALIADITAASIGAATAAQGAKADSALQSGDVAPVALSGSYTALSDKPTLFGLSSLLTGLGAGTNTAITDADSLINALAKLQAQITSASSPSSPSGVLTQPKFNGSRYPANLWYDCFYPFQYPLVSSYFLSYQQYLIRFTALEDATFTKLGFWCPTTSIGVNDGGYYLGVYSSDSNGNPSTALYRSAALTNVNTTGAKTTTLSISLTKGQTVWLSVLLYAYSGSLYYTGIRQDNIVIPAISGASALNAASATAYISTLQNVVSLPATIDMGTFSQISLSLYLPRLMLGT